MRAASVAALLGTSFLAFAQVPATSASSAKGVFEPVNYSEDLALTDVYFVTPEIGYVSGASGTILKTTDAGATWTAQLGGDPASGGRSIDDLRFVSETVGWATQIAGQAHLLQTRDGETWEEVASIPEHYVDLVFTSKTDGSFSYNKGVYQTHDGGRTWARVYDCRVKAEVAGLARTLECEITRMHFPSPTVGYAVARHSDAALILKTSDAGVTWEPVYVMEDETGADPGLFFVDETTGYVSMHHSGKSYRTTDGGRTWTGLAGTALGQRIRFADPEIGWSFRDPCVGAGCANAGLTYTTDGGRRWASRSFPLPAAVRAFSFPRRDVAYVVGEHGMIYRYRSLPAGDVVAPKAVAAIPMPAIANGVIAQLAKMDTQLDAVDAAFEKAGTAAESGRAATAWVDEHVPGEIAQLETVADAVGTGLPELGRRHRNLNLMLQGLELLGNLTGQGNGIRQAFASLRQARDAASVSAALLSLHSELDAAKTSVEAFQTRGVP